MFQTLHLMFEAQYTELALAVDLIAERIRSLGFPAPGTYKQFAALSSIKETEGVPNATTMISAIWTRRRRIKPSIAGRTLQAWRPRLARVHCCLHDIRAANASAARPNRLLRLFEPDLGPLVVLGRMDLVGLDLGRDDREHRPPERQEHD